MSSGAPRLRNIPREQVRERAASFERPGVLKLFELERQGKIGQAEVGP
jgi:hypothetical protein